MSTVQIETKDVRRAYAGAEANVKKTLKDLFPDVNFSDNIKDLVQTFEDACAIVGVDVSDVIITGLAPDEIAYRKLKIIAQALNEGWKPNWNDNGEYKYFPYFDMSGSFSYYGYRNWYRSSCVGSRLCFKSADLAIYAGKQFTDIYKDFMTFQN